MDTDLMLWVDVETTGLNPHQGAVLEVALVATGPKLEVLDQGSWLVNWSPSWVQEFRRICDPVVRDMHAASGLWDDLIRQGGTGIGDDLTTGPVHTGMTRFVESIPGLWDAPLAGSSVGQFDAVWLNVWFPDWMERRTAYRVVDVSTWKETLRRWRPEVVESRPEAKKLHRALPDIYDSIAEFRHYGQALGLLP